MGGVVFVCRTRTRKALLYQRSCRPGGALHSCCLLTPAIHGILRPAQRGVLEPPEPPPGYATEDYTRSTRRNDLTVSFTDLERPHSVHFERIRKFFSYPANSDDSIHVTVIQQVEIHPCSEIQSLHFPPEIQSLSPLLCSDYFSFSTGNHVAIPIYHILSKCFDVSTSGLSVIIPMVCSSMIQLHPTCYVVILFCVLYVRHIIYAAGSNKY